MGEGGVLGCCTRAAGGPCTRQLGGRRSGAASALEHRRLGLAGGPLQHGGQHACSDDGGDAFVPAREGQRRMFTVCARHRRGRMPAARLRLSAAAARIRPLPGRLCALPARHAPGSWSGGWQARSLTGEGALGGGREAVSERRRPVCEGLAARCRIVKSRLVTGRARWGAMQEHRSAGGRAAWGRVPSTQPCLSTTTIARSAARIVRTHHNAGLPAHRLPPAARPAQQG